MKYLAQAQKYGRKIAQRSAAGVVVVLGTVAQAHAALPTEVTTAFTDLKSNWTDMSPLIWGTMVPVVAGFALMKLFKKGASKAV